MSFDLETEGAPPPPDNPPAPAAQEQPPAPQEAAPPPAQEPEGVEVAGEKMVPLAALQAERETVKGLRAKAQQADQMAQWYHQAKPYVDFLQANPDLMKPRQAEPAPPPEAKPQDDPALINLARTLDLYTPEGQPDAARAATIRNLVKSEAQTIAQAAVQPIHEQTIQQRAQQNYQQALNVNLGGVKPDPDVLAQIWRGGDPKALATTEGAAAAVMMALGLGVARQPAPAPQTTVQPPEQPPIVTEVPGGRNVTRAPMTEFEQRVLNIRGIPASKYQEYTAGFKPGQSNVLED